MVAAASRTVPCRAAPHRVLVVPTYSTVCRLFRDFVMPVGGVWAGSIDPTAVPDSLMMIHVHARLRVERVEKEAALVEKGRTKAVVVVERDRWVGGLTAPTTRSEINPLRCPAYAAAFWRCCGVFYYCAVSCCTREPTTRLSFYPSRGLEFVCAAQTRRGLRPCSGSVNPILPLCRGHLSPAAPNPVPDHSPRGP